MAKKSANRDQTVCSVKGCSNPHHARGLCQKHYDEFRKKNRKPASSQGRKTCSVEGCKRTHHAKGYCKMHYAKLVKGSIPRGPAGDVTLPHDSQIQDSSDPQTAEFLEKRLQLIRRRHQILLKKLKTKNR
ncbi:MAG: hypothetical protein JW909_06520 [Planctomycetes bacterium]|nr:hypothetical protein [Planctomycetota bacterium]